MTTRALDTLTRMSGPLPPDPAVLWPLYARHGAVILAGGPAPSLHATERAILIISGAGHVDMNQAALFGGAGTGDARELVDHIRAADVPVLLGCSASAQDGVAAILAGAGFVHLPKRESMFWMPGASRVAETSPFETRRLETDADVAAMQRMFLEAHGYEPELTGSLFDRTLRRDDAATGWIAWDGPEPVSFAMVTQVGASLSLWNVLTPPRHRRRGAARAVVASALAAVGARAAAFGQPIEHTVFWSSPAGQPLYLAMGFEVVDTIDAWVLGASDADLAAVGQ